MSFQTKADQDLIDAVNAKNTTTFAVGDFLYSDPKPISGSWQSQITNKNTVIRLTAKASTGYEGYVDILYNRLDLSLLAKIPGLLFRVQQTTTLYAELAKIQADTGIQFTTDDLEDQTITVQAGVSEVSVLLKAKTNSLGWIGQLAATFYVTGYSLIEKAPVVDLVGLALPGFGLANATTVVQAPLYFYATDFTPLANTLIDFDTGVISSTDAAMFDQYFTSVDHNQPNHAWGQLGSNYTTLNAEVLVNGINDQPDANPAYKYVMKLQLACPEPAGVLYLHYNDPVTPGNF